MKKIWMILLVINHMSHALNEDEAFKRPIGFNLNLGSIASLTFEGRFFLGLNPKFSLVLSPSFQNTVDLPWPHTKRDYVSLFSIRRLNLGAGVKIHFYDYDSKDGWYIEPMLRGGFFWAGDDKSMWSLIPSFLVGYTTIYDSGFMVSFGLGLEYEFLFGKKGYYTDFLTTAYYGITKVPLTAEFSLGWVFGKN